MDTMPLYLVFLHSIPENVILILLGLVLIGVRPSLARVLWVALLVALASYFIRALPLPPGINVFIQLPVLILLLAFLCSLHLTYATVASFLGLILLGLAETVYNLVVPALTGITVQQAMDIPLWRALYPLPEYVLLGLVIMALIRYDVVIYDIRGAFDENRISSTEERLT